jgi:hypothetical protein
MRKFLLNFMKMKEFLVKILKHHGLFLINLVFVALLRFYRLPEMASFDFDQEYASNFAWSVLREFPIQMIGQGLSVQGLFMGPIYFYYLVPFFALFNLHPLGGAVGSVVLGLGIVIAYYFFANEMFGKPAGLIAAFLRGILFSELETDWSMVPAYSSELLVLVTWYCFYQYWRQNTKYLPLLGLVFGLYTSFHPILFPFYLVFLALMVIRRIWPNLRTSILSLGAFLIPLAPLVLFEYFHKFLEVKVLMELFLNPKPDSTTSVWFLMRRNINILLTGLPSLFGLRTSLPHLLSVIILGAVSTFVLKGSHISQKFFHLFALFVTLLIFVLYYSFLPVHVPDYYFMAPITIFFFYLAGVFGCLIKNLVGRTLVFLFLGYLLLVNIRLLSQKWSSPSLATLAHKDKIVKTIIERQPKNREFFVSYIHSPGWNFGFPYLFKLYGRLPKDRVVDNYTYTIVVPKGLIPEEIDIVSGNIGLILPDNQKD